MKKSNVRKVVSPAICDDLSVAVKMFSTAPGEWLDGLIRGLSMFGSSEDVKRSVAAAGEMIRCVGDVEKHFPAVTEKAENLKTALRRFSDAVILAFNDGGADALLGPRERLRDAGDAFSAAVAQIAAGGMSNGEVPDLRMAFYEEAVARYAVDRNDAGQDVCFDDVLRDMFSDRKFALAFRRRSRAFDSMKKNFYNFAKRKGLKLPSVTVKMHRRG